MQYEINKEIVFSTYHVSYEDWKILSDIKVSDFVVGVLTKEVYTYGVRILVINDIDTTQKTPLSNAFWTLMGIANSFGCKWLVIDQDGITYPLLETFDW